jgi:hypothetical protein
MRDPLFILCPPRSYSSLICSMIGQHPECYGLPELNLFLGDTLGESWEAYPNLRQLLTRHGLLRTLAQLHEGAQTTATVAHARDWVTQHWDWPIDKVLDHIQELVGDRILVEKSPSTAFERGNIERMLNACPKANILHLIRHPRGTAESLVSQRSTHKQLNLAVGSFAAREPERVWRTTHELILAATEHLPLGQCLRLKGEALLSDLENYLRQICEWLEIRTDEEAIRAMFHPEKSPYANLGPATASRGNDPNFLENPKIDRKRLAKLREPRLDGELSWRPGEAFAPATRRLAKQFGYK